MLFYFLPLALIFALIQDSFAMKVEENQTDTKENQAILTIGENKYNLSSKTVNGTSVIMLSPKVLRNKVVILDQGSRCSNFLLPSKISSVISSSSTLIYQGKNINELSDSRFECVFDLLLSGSLPKDPSFICLQFDKKYVDWFLQKPSNGSDPMRMLQSLVLDMDQIFNINGDKATPQQLMGAMLTLFGVVHSAIYQKESLQPKPYWTVVANLSYMIMGNVFPQRHTDKLGILSALMILHMDHGYNLSTTTALTVQSGGASKLAVLSAAIGALSGPKHGGANIAVIKMLEKINACKERSVDEEINRLVNEASTSSNIKIPGIGHREYRGKDPRATIIEKLLEEADIQDPLLIIAKKLEKKIKETPYFTERKLYPNLDFYSGLALRVCGVPTDMLPVFFAVCRTAGWLAHMKECEGKLDIIRPTELPSDY